MLSRSAPHPSCAPCLLLAWVSAILLFMTALLSLVGVYKAHILRGGMTFSTAEGALYIIAFCISLTLWTRQMTVCCGCETRKK